MEELSISISDGNPSVPALAAGQLFANTDDIEAGIERAVLDSSSNVVGFQPFGCIY